MVSAAWIDMVDTGNLDFTKEETEIGKSGKVY
jgi:hypothetical protein